ncbi:LOW QUALITY PROTEIN: U7 snRNA-associated Sm-like protein LSm11 [Pelodytes ibericus]
MHSTLHTTGPPEISTTPRARYTSSSLDSTSAISVPKQLASAISVRKKLASAILQSAQISPLVLHSAILRGGRISKKAAFYAAPSSGAPPVQAAGASRDPMAEEAIPEGSLDVSSQSFDPLLALYSPNTPLPFPDVRCFNNLAEYESFLRGGGRGRARAPTSKKVTRKGRKPAPDPERVERLKQLMLPEEEGDTRAKPRRKTREPKNVLTRMPLHAGSPLGEMNRCVQDRIRVKVHIRTFKGLRGVCSGFIVAFDKFWNMAMVDVDETYRKPVLGKAFYHEPQLTLNRLFERLKLQETGLQTEPDAPKKRPVSGAGHERGTNTGSLPPSTHPNVKSSGSKKNSEHTGDILIGTPVGNTRGCPGEKRQRDRPPKEKVDYQQVFTRHLNQVFIRGENILLINITQ